ncbi:endonuclease [Marivita sp. S6314]|uniref:endonuclease n=1 Tax=Marivita sp. S6314 TaxID=2926406 RepID=UPI001FF6E835|nr:endonuclease [Marivita sp. S6314]MCK0148762.1 endonuclease [Marivita sp. S6314]
MQQQNSGMSCPLGSWALAAGVGLLLFVLLLVLGDWSFIGAVFAAGVVFVILGLLFNWIFCRDLPAPRGPGNIDDSTASATSAPAPKAAAPSAPSPTAPPPAVDPAPTASEETSPASSGKVAPTVTASASLPGQDELAARKGEWKYEGGTDKAAKTPDADASNAPAAKAAAPEAAPESATPDYDGDGVKEGTGEGAKPQTLTAAREGGPDNLKEIKGVGPKLEQLLHSMGFYHFDQIANWTDDEVAWVNANLEGFKGRVSRDNWVEQAKILAAGGDTEFSKRVDKGDVY